jgi:hypothetical protein
LTIANSLPWMDGEDLLRAGAWGSRGWTFQERFRSQRALLIGDDGMIFNCTHTYSPEDEHCSHTITKNKRMIARGNWIFFTGQDKRCVPYLTNLEPFDNYSMYVFEYTRQSLTYQADVLTAFLGILQHLQIKLLCQFIHGLPEGEFDAALLWSPVGPSIRRCDPETKQPLFPSWSWLGWVGPAAYPWSLERDTFMSTATSPLRWQDAGVANNRVSSGLGEASESHFSGVEAQEAIDTDDGSWFTSDDFCLPPSPTKATLLSNFRKKGARTTSVSLDSSIVAVNCARSGSPNTKSTGPAGSNRVGNMSYPTHTA